MTKSEKTTIYLVTVQRAVGRAVSLVRNHIMDIIFHAPIYLRRLQRGIECCDLCSGAG